MRLMFAAPVLALLLAGCGGAKESATSNYCSVLSALFAQHAKATPYTYKGTTGNVEALARVDQTMADEAPSQIHGDFEMLARAFKAFAHTFMDAGLKPGQSPISGNATQLQLIDKAASALDAPKLQSAAQHVQAWAAKNCGGVFVTTTG